MTDFQDRTSVRTALFVKVDVEEYKETPSSAFAPKTLLTSDHFTDFELLPGENYTALGELLNVTSTVRELTPSSSTVNVQISGVPQSSLNQITQSRLKGSPITITRGFFELDGSPLIEFAREKLPVTRIGTAATSNEQSIFGNSLKILNKNSGVSATPLDLGLSDFTIECYFRVTEADSLVESYIFDLREFGTTKRRPYLLISNNKVTLVAGPGAQGDLVLAESNDIELNEWYHVAVVRRFDEYKLFLNGTIIGPAAKDTAFRGKINLDTGPIHIGTRHAIDQSGTRQSLIGFIDEFRVSNTSRYWTSNVNQPEIAQNLSDTMLMLRFDEGNNSIAFIDDNTPQAATKVVGKFQGFVNNVIFEEEWDVQERMTTITVNLDCSSTIDLLGKKRGGRKTNSTSMRRFFPSDASFDRVAAIVDANINFGGTG